MEELFSKSVEELNLVCKFTEEEMKILENADKAAEEMAMPEYEHYLKHEFNHEATEIAAKYGLLGIPIKKEYGGSGFRPIISTLAKERLGQLGMGFSSFFNVQVFLCAQTIQRWGREEQKKTYLPQAVKKDKIFAFGLTEPEAGSDPSSLKTEYEKKGDKYILNGTKYLISNGTIADYLIIFARSKEREGDNGSTSKISAFIVDAKSSGIERTALREKIGLFTSDTGMIDLNNVEIGEECTIGEPGKGLPIAYSALLNARLGVASGCVGVIEAALNAVINRSRERVQFGKPIGRHQLIQQHISVIRQNLEMARWPTYFAAIRKGEYEENPNNKDLLKEIDLRVSLAKRTSSRLAFESADHAVQVFGGFGYSLLSPVGQLFCDSRVTRIYEGTDEIQDLKIASSLLGKDFEAYA